MAGCYGIWRAGTELGAVQKEQDYPQAKGCQIFRSDRGIFVFRGI